jgi:transcription termination/antitermination protein NusG
MRQGDYFFAAVYFAGLSSHSSNFLGGLMDTSKVNDGEWIAVQVRCGYEERISRGLRERGYDEFMPTRTNGRHHDRRVQCTKQSLFPGYVFCRYVHAPSYRIVEVPGVIRLVGVGNTLTAIPEVEIESIRRVAESGISSTPCAAISIGQPVIICRGALTGVCGILVSTARKRHLIVSISLLGRAVAVELHENDVVAGHREFCATDGRRAEHALLAS